MTADWRPAYRAEVADDDVGVAVAVAIDVTDIQCGMCGRADLQHVPHEPARHCLLQPHHQRQMTGGFLPRWRHRARDNIQIAVPVEIGCLRSLDAR